MTLARGATGPHAAGPDPNPDPDAAGPDPDPDPDHDSTTLPDAALLHDAPPPVLREAPTQPVSVCLIFGFHIYWRSKIGKQKMICTHCTSVFGIMFMDTCTFFCNSMFS